MRLYLGVCAGCVLAVGCGGEQDDVPVDTGGGQMVDSCADAAALETRLIGDFEQANALGFSSNTDVVSSSSTPPLPPQTGSDTPGLPTARFDSARCGVSTSGIHVVLRDVVDGGYSIQVNNITTAIPNPGGPAYFDATDYTGVSFWARIGAGSNSTFFAAIKERYTQPGTATLFSEAEADQLLASGSYCEFNATDVDGNPGVDPTLTQCDAFGKGIGLGDEWRFFKVPFAAMKQRAYGRPSQHPVPDQRIFGLEIRVENGPHWDFWLDDVAFYREP
jgi:hypothetical protein